MEHRLLGRSGLKVPVLSFGTGTFGGGNEFFRTWGEIDVVEAKRLIGICPDVGVDLFETTDIYSNGLSEEILGLNRLLQRPIVSTIVMGAQRRTAEAEPRRCRLESYVRASRETRCRQ